MADHSKHVAKCCDAVALHDAIDGWQLFLRSFCQAAMDRSKLFPCPMIDPNETFRGAHEKLIPTAMASTREEAAFR